MYTKKIKKDIKNAGMYDAIAWTAGYTLLIWGVLALMQRTDMLVWGLASAVIVLIVLLVLFSFVSMSRIRALKKNIEAQQCSIAFDDDHYILVAPDLAIGQEWLVYHNGNRYRCIAHSNVSSFNVNGRNAVLELKEPAGTVSLPIVNQYTAQIIHGWSEGTIVPSGIIAPAE
jgi:hypothetical protein